MAYAWVVWDIFALLVLLYVVGRCAAKGLVRTVVEFFGYLIAAGVAGALSTWLAELLYEQIVRDVLEVVITRQMDAALADGASFAAELLEGIPKGLQRIMLESGGTLAEGLIDGETAALVSMLVESTLKNPVLSILRGVCFMVVFGVVLLVVRQVSRLFTGLYHIPVVGTLNTLLGGVVGALEGVLFLYLIAVVLQIVIAASGDTLPWLNSQLIDSTYIYRVFFSFS